ncbi:MAG TPA: dTMP kinase [Gemmatimonadales bacterium]
MATGSPGAFVVVEGPEGAGKTSLVRWLVARLRDEGRMVLAVREPGGTPVAEAARKLALESRHEMSDAAELFLILAARADLVARVVRPALEEGRLVLADRFDLSTLCYQVAGRGLNRNDVEAALRLATGGLAPDLQLVLDVTVAVGRERQRIAGKSQDRFEREDDGFHERVRRAYADARGPGIVHLDATQPPDKVQAAAWREIAAATALTTRGVT